MSTNVLADNGAAGLKEVAALTDADLSATAAANKVPIAGADGLLNASWGVTSGTPASAVEDQIRNTLALNNADPIDQKIIAGDYIVLLFLGSHNMNNWKPATSAVHTVTTGKKLVILERRYNNNLADTNNRRMRLYNTTNSLVELDFELFIGEGSFWSGDVDTATKFPEIAAGNSVRLELWNGDLLKRAIGGLIICREVDV